MIARKQLFVLLTVLMLVCSSGAVVIGVTAVGQDTDAGEDDADGPDDATADEQDEPADDTADDEPDDADETEEAPDDAPDETPDDAPGEQQPAHVTFEDQESDGETVVVDEVSMVNGGFVTIHDSSLLAGDALGSVVGVSEYLEEGTHEDVEIELDEPLEEDETLIAMPHRDTNDNQEYDFVETEGEEDVPYLTAEDEPVTDEAVVTLEEDAETDAADESTEEEPVEEPVDEEPVDEEPAGENGVGDDAADDHEVEDDAEGDEATEHADDQRIEITIEQGTVHVVDQEPAENETSDGESVENAEDDAETAMGCAAA